MTFALPRVFEEKSASGFIPSTGLALLAPTFVTRHPSKSGVLYDTLHHRHDAQSLGFLPNWVWRSRLELVYAYFNTLGPAESVAPDETDASPTTPVPFERLTVYSLSELVGDQSDPKTAATDLLNLVTDVLWSGQNAPATKHNSKVITIGDSLLIAAPEHAISVTHTLLSAIRQSNASMPNSGAVSMVRRGDSAALALDRSVLTRLEAAQLPATSGPISLEEFAKQVSRIADVPVVVEPSATASRPELLLLLRAERRPPMSAREALELISSADESALDWNISGGTVQISAGTLPPVPASYFCVLRSHTKITTREQADPRDTNILKTLDRHGRSQFQRKSASWTIGHEVLVFRIDVLTMDRVEKTLHFLERVASAHNATSIIVEPSGSWEICASAERLDAAHADALDPHAFAMAMMDSQLPVLIPPGILRTGPDGTTVRRDPARVPDIATGRNRPKLVAASSYAFCVTPIHAGELANARGTKAGSWIQPLVAYRLSDSERSVLGLLDYGYDIDGNYRTREQLSDEFNGFWISRQRPEKHAATLRKLQRADPERWQYATLSVAGDPWPAPILTMNAPPATRSTDP